MKNCPFCAEEIQDEAIKCKHCGSMVDGGEKDKTEVVQSVHIKCPGCGKGWDRFTEYCKKCGEKLSNNHPSGGQKTEHVFYYQAKDRDTKEIEGQIEATSQEDALNKLYEQDLTVVTIKPLQSGNKNSGIVFGKNIGARSLDSSKIIGYAILYIIICWAVVSIYFSFVNPTSSKVSAAGKKSAYSNDLDLVGSIVTFNDETPVAISKEVYREYVETVSARDIDGWRQMKALRIVYDVPSGTKVKVISLDGPWNSLAKIRILDGRNSSQIVWVAIEAIKGYK